MQQWLRGNQVLSMFFVRNSLFFTSYSMQDNLWKELFSKVQAVESYCKKASKRAGYLKYQIFLAHLEVFCTKSLCTGLL